MKWVTRPHIRVNRTATAWLIRRFIDPEATFLFVDAERVAEIQRAEGAIGFDAPGTIYPHADARGRCSFEALVEERLPDDSALHALARIVHGADFDELHVAHESGGLRTVSRGFPLVSPVDEETVERASFLYDALYAVLKQGGKP